MSDTMERPAGGLKPKQIAWLREHVPGLNDYLRQRQAEMQENLAS